MAVGEASDEAPVAALRADPKLAGGVLIVWRSKGARGN